MPQQKPNLEWRCE